MYVPTTHAIQMPHICHMQATSCIDIRQLCQYIYRICTCSNEHCDHKHCYTYTLRYWHIPLDKYACHIANACPTALLLESTYRPHITTHTKSKEQQTATLNYHAIAIYVPIANMPIKCHMYKLALVQRHNFVYISYMNSLQSIPYMNSLPSNYHATALYVPATNMPLKCHIYTTCLNYLTCIYEGSMPKYIAHMMLLPSLM